MISDNPNNNLMETPENLNPDYKTIVKTAVLNESTFIHMTLSNRLHADQTPWIRIKVRPVLVKGQRKLQFSYFDPKKDITKNYSGAEIEKHLDEALALGFGQINLQSVTGDLNIRITPKGMAAITHGKSSRSHPEPNLAHNHAKRYPLSADTSDSFLQAVGIMNKHGRVLAPMRGKFVQINEFLRVIEQTVPAPKDRPVEIVDCGCGSSYLTFAVYHYLHNIRHLPVHLTGVDYNPELVAKSVRLRDSLGWSGIEFQAGNIAGFEPKLPPDMVLSLHACDTATDQVIAKGILWQSRVVLAVPCCQHELHNQLKAPLFHPVLRHGILKERLADILTDTFRALVLRIMGYNTGVIEFISPENTAKNLLIRAERGIKPGEAQFIKEYLALKDFWQVEPVIEKLLGEKIGVYLKN